MDGHQLIAKTALARRAVKCTTTVSQAVPLIYGHIHSLRRTLAVGALQENMYVVRFRQF